MSYLVQENSDSEWREIADYAQGVNIPYAVTGSLPEDLPSHDTYAYWIIVKPADGVDYQQGSAQLVLSHEDGTFEDVTGALYSGLDNGLIVAGAADIKSAVPGVGPKDKLTLFYTGSFNERYLIGLERGNTSYAHVEYSSEIRASVDQDASRDDLHSTASLSAKPAKVSLAVQRYGERGSAARPATGGAAWPMVRCARDEPADREGLTESPEIRATVYSYEVDIYKTAGDSGNALAGAKFALRNESGEWYVLGESWSADRADATVVTTDALGHALFRGVDSEYVELVEVQAPAGYGVLDPVDVTIESAIVEGRAILTASSKAAEVSDVDSRGGTVSVSVADPASAGSQSGSDAALGAGYTRPRLLGFLPTTGDPVFFVWLAVISLVSALSAGLVYSRAKRQRLHVGESSGSAPRSDREERNGR